MTRLIFSVLFCLSASLLNVQSFAEEKEFKIESFPNKSVRLFDEDGIIIDTISNSEADEKFGDRGAILIEETGMYQLVRDDDSRVWVLSTDVNVKRDDKARWSCDEIAESTESSGSSGFINEDCKK